MRCRPLAVLALAVTVSACSAGGIHTTPTSQPSTTMTPTPVSPTGVADTARRWVATVATAGQEDAAFADLAPRSQAAVGGRDGYGARVTAVRQIWGAWATAAGVAFDAVPVRADVALVIIHAPVADGSERGAALPMRLVGGEWRPEPLDQLGEVTLAPADRVKVSVRPSLSTTVPSGTDVAAFVDGHAADVRTATPAGAATARVVYRPQQDLAPGWHLVALAYAHGDDVSGAIVRYQVVGTK